MQWSSSAPSLDEPACESRWLAFQSSSNPSIESSETGVVSQRLPLAATPPPSLIGTLVGSWRAGVGAVSEVDDGGTSGDGVAAGRCEPEPHAARATTNAICVDIAPTVPHKLPGRASVG